MKVLLFLYNILFIFVIFFYTPFYIFRKKFSLKAFFEKLSFLPPEIKPRDSIWIQAVSVGEVLLIKKLVNQLKQAADLRIVISTTTLTGFSVAKKQYPSFTVIFFPFDITFILKRVIQKVCPRLFVAMETEIWPNLYHQLNKRNIPVIILNGRISDKAYKKYSKIKFFTKKVLALCSCIGVQSQSYREKFLSLGAKPDKVFVSGNMKFDNLDISTGRINNFKSRYQHLLKKDGRSLFIAASTHSPEEEAVLDLYLKLRRDFGVNLLIAPRHPERIKEVARAVISRNLNPIMISEIESSKWNPDDIFLLDTIGELIYFYAMSDICFVGGSLTDRGGHNILEPMYFAKPVIFGPFMSNFKEIEKIALAHNAAVKVRNSKELEAAAISFLRDSVSKENIARNCLKVFNEEKELLKENLKIILKYLNRHE